jgi:hypothetical protein
MTPRALCLFACTTLSLACGPSTSESLTDIASEDSGSSVADTDEPTTDGSSSGTTDATTDATTGEYVRVCQDDDFLCDDWGCGESPGIDEGQCYKPCTPDGEIGGVDDECDEPGRPFCSQTGKALGGDYACNACAHVCVGESFEQCGLSVDSCTP